jgi:hypothetical protein
MDKDTEFAVQVEFDKRQDGRFYIHSPSLPGLHLAGPDLEKIRVDLEPVVRDLLRYNHGMVVDTIRWVPSIDDVVRSFRKDDEPTPPSPQPGKPSFLLIRGHQAAA